MRLRNVLLPIERNKMKREEYRRCSLGLVVALTALVLLVGCCLPPADASSSSLFFGVEFAYSVHVRSASSPNVLPSPPSSSCPLPVFSFVVVFVLYFFLYFCTMRSSHRLAQLSFDSFTSVSAKAQKMKTVTAESGSGGVLWNAQVYDCTTKRGSSLKQH